MKLICVILLLKAGARVNITESNDHSQKCLGNIFRYKYPRPHILHEHHGNVTLSCGRNHKEKLRDNLKPFVDMGLNLKYKCRHVIREHLLAINHSTNLFITVPQLGLSTLLRDCLLYNMKQNRLKTICIM